MNGTNTVYVIVVIDHINENVVIKGVVSSQETALAVSEALRSYLFEDCVYVHEATMDAVVEETAERLRGNLEPYTKMLNSLKNLERLLE